MATVKLSVGSVNAALEVINTILKDKVRSGKLAMLLGIQRSYLAPTADNFETVRKATFAEFATDEQIITNSDAHDAYITKIEDAIDAEVDVQLSGLSVEDFALEEANSGEAFTTLLPFLKEYTAQHKQQYDKNREQVKKFRTLLRAERADSAEKRKESKAE